jgi:hypothetical protein
VAARQSTTFSGFSAALGRGAALTSPRGPRECPVACARAPAGVNVLVDQRTILRAGFVAVAAAQHRRTARILRLDRRRATGGRVDRVVHRCARAVGNPTARSSIVASGGSCELQPPHTLVAMIDTLPRTSGTIGSFRLAVCVLVVLAVAVGLILSFAVPAARNGDVPSSFGADAGYVWRGPIVSVQGSWRVPRVLKSSRSGLAATWIGALGSGAQRPFIQIGTEELHGYSRSHTAENRYWAFWSDTVHEFHPVFLGRVKAGDAITARLVLKHERWILTLTDVTSHAPVQFSTNEEAKASFTEAEWTQEDATGSTGSVSPYPVLSDVTFNHLGVNFARPSYASLYSTWMSVNGRNFAPTPLRHGEFTLHGATLTATGRRYLQMGARWLAAAHLFTSELEHSSRSHSHAEISSARLRFVTALGRDSRALQHSSFPASVRGMVRLLIDHFDALRAQSTPPASVTSATLARWVSAFGREANALLYIEHLIRRALGVPELP